MLAEVAMPYVKAVISTHEPAPLYRRAAHPEISAGLREPVGRHPRGQVPGWAKVPQRSGAGTAVPNVSNYHRPRAWRVDAARVGGSNRGFRNLRAACALRRKQFVIRTSHHGSGEYRDLRAHLPR